jgi:hypothetical protein
MADDHAKGGFVTDSTSRKTALPTDLDTSDLPSVDVRTGDHINVWSEILAILDFRVMILSQSYRFWHRK